MKSQWREACYHPLPSYSPVTQGSWRHLLFSQMVVRCLKRTINSGTTEDVPVPQPCHYSWCLLTFTKNHRLSVLWSMEELVWWLKGHIYFSEPRGRRRTWAEYHSLAEHFPAGRVDSIIGQIQSDAGDLTGAEQSDAPPKEKPLLLLCEIYFK